MDLILILLAIAASLSPVFVLSNGLPKLPISDIDDDEISQFLIIKSLNNNKRGSHVRG